jgi:hypothetical protein
VILASTSPNIVRVSGLSPASAPPALEIVVRITDELADYVAAGIYAVGFQASGTTSRAALSVPPAAAPIAASRPSSRALLARPNAALGLAYKMTRLPLKATLTVIYSPVIATF